MEINLQELLEGKGTIIKNREYYPTKNYVEPFINRMSPLTSDFKIMVKLPDQMTMNPSNLDKTFNRVWIQAKLPDSYSHGDYNQVIGFIYGLDIRKPVVKFYRGAVNKDSSNLIILNSNWLTIQELEPECPIDFTPIQGLLELTDDLKVKINNLDNQEQVSGKFNDLGKWIHNTIKMSYDNDITQKVKLATSDTINAYKSLTIDSDSDYYVKAGEMTSKLNIFEAFAKQLTNNQEKDLINTVEKTLLIKNILEIN